MRAGRASAPGPSGTTSTARARNDPRQYDDLVDEWWRADGAFAALHWLADARAELVPPPEAEGAVLVDVGCGGGLLAPRIAGYRHVGVDLTASALGTARGHGVVPVQADAAAIPLADGVASVVVAGEILEHVADVSSVVAELCRLLRPGGTVVIDTISDTRLARFAMVMVAERLPGGPPPRIHDPHLFVGAAALRQLFARHGVSLEVQGLRPAVVDYARFLFDRSRSVRMLPTRSTAVVYRGFGRKC